MKYRNEEQKIGRTISLWKGKVQYLGAISGISQI